MTSRETTPSADPLGNVLHALRVTGVFYCRCELGTPWGVTLPAMREYLWFHVVTEGHCLLEVDGAEPHELRPGEFALLPHGMGHRLRSESDVDVPMVTDLPHEYVGDRYAILRHGGDGVTTRLVCGAVRLDHPAARTVRAMLPSLTHLATLSEPQTDWMHATLRLIAAECQQLRPGGDTMITRLCDVLVVQAVRSWVENAPAERAGWLGALRDPRIGRAISLIHHQPGHPWTVRELAREVAMSRSAFAERFTELAGEPVVSYLTRWRMYLAADTLQHGDVAVGELATRLGYRSDAAFRKAFKRVMGFPPGEVGVGEAALVGDG